jgi:hypothetical protein
MRLFELGSIFFVGEQNKLTVNISKSKEIVLCNSRSKCLFSPPAVICNTEQVKEVKLNSRGFV